METLVIKLNQPEKAKLLMELLKSLDFISNVEYFDKYVKAKELLDEINKLASQTPLVEMTQEEIDEEISSYRHGK
ncbi:MAG: hypothetical protein EPO28_03725 [Saprospiraceae bacterium]|nr:MAG: hypothetical protein EPO28_03725 [Saprospiraceae bacterium]